MRSRGRVDGASSAPFIQACNDWNGHHVAEGLRVASLDDGRQRLCAEQFVTAATGSRTRRSRPASSGRVGRGPFSGDQIERSPHLVGPRVALVRTRFLGLVDIMDGKRDAYARGVDARPPVAHGAGGGSHRPRRARGRMVDDALPLARVTLQRRASCLDAMRSERMTSASEPGILPCSWAKPTTFASSKALRCFRLPRGQHPREDR